MPFMASPLTYAGRSISQEEWDKALELAERWQDIRTDESYGPQGKWLGTLARALLHVKQCYEEQVKLNAE